MSFINNANIINDGYLLRLYFFKRFWRIFSIAPILIFFSCTIEPDPDQLNLVMAGDPKSIDPAYATDVRTGKICALLYDNLIRFGKGTELLPGVSKKWQITENGKKYTFHLQTDVEFHNGEKLTAKDVLFSFERILHPETRSHRTWLFNKVRGAKEFQEGITNTVSGFEVVNDSVFSITLIEPFAPFLGFLAMPSASVMTIDENEKIIGTGPWLLDEWIHDGHLIFRRNPNYFAGAPEFERLKFRILPEALPRTAEFATGYLDMMEIPESEYSLWADDKNWQPHIYKQDELNIYYIGLNCSRPPFDNVLVRQAVNLAVDVETIITAVNNGKGIPAAGPVPPQLLKNSTIAPYGYNPERARELLQLAGFSAGFEIELWQSQSPELLTITEAIQAQLSEIGIIVKIVRNDWNMFSQAINQGRPDMYYRSWWADYPDAENFLAPLFETEVSKKRWTRYSNLTLDSLILDLQSETDEMLRNEIALQANDILHRDAPWIYLWHSQSATIVNQKLKNWQPSLMFNAEKFLKK